MIYFAQLPTGAIKIGSSKNVHNRLRLLSYEYGDRLPLLAVIPGGRREEHQVHRRFAHLRFPGTEQFRAAPELLDFISRPLFMPKREATQAHRVNAQPYDFGVTPKELRSLEKERAKLGGVFKSHHEMVRWLIWIAHRALEDSRENPRSTP